MQVDAVPNIPNLPELTNKKFTGKLFVIEGTDGSGRSTQISLLSAWLEQRGYSVTHMGLRRSNLVSAQLEQAKQGNTLMSLTMSLFYATDFYDQLINLISPALGAGSIVLADRYIYTLMARDILRGVDRQWVESLYSLAIKPQGVFYLNVHTPRLIERTFQKKGWLDYWESGMDLRLSSDIFTCFCRYQKRLRAEFRQMQKVHQFQIINGNRGIEEIQEDLREHLRQFLGAPTK